MHSVKYTLALASLAGLAALSSCTLITDVDRSKIPTGDSTGDAGETNGGGSNGGGSGTGGSSTGDIGEAGTPSDTTDPGAAGSTP